MKDTALAMLYTYIRTTNNKNSFISLGPGFHIFFFPLLDNEEKTGQV